MGWESSLLNVLETRSRLMESKSKKDSDEGTKKADELNKGEEFSRRGKKPQKDEGGLRHSLRFLLNAHAHHRGNDHAHHHDQRRNQEKPYAAEVVLHLFSKYGEDPVQFRPP